MKTGERRDFDKEAAGWDEKPQRLMSCSRYSIAFQVVVRPPEASRPAMLRRPGLRGRIVS
ncbi:MAG: hypothetical protein ACLPN1_13925 [Dissulfurispiraceae bacterium]